MGVFSAAAVLCLVVAVGADDYENNLTKLWSVSGSTRAGGSRTAVVNVTRASLTIQPRSERQAKVAADFHPYKYAFKPRAIPLRPEARSVHYATEKQKSEILFPGNYFPIAEEKKENLSEDASTFNPLSGGPFRPKEIPLLREYPRSFSDDDGDEEEPIIERPGAYVGQTASRRSISTLFEDDEEDDEDADDAEFEEDETPDKLAKKKGKPSKIGKKYARYMLPLLLAYKMKFFSMIPLMMGGLVLLVGATGMAGFFFALFAAVMGLQKGSY